MIDDISEAERNELLKIHQDYTLECNKAADLADEGKYEEAVEAFEKLINQENIEGDEHVLWVNVAVLREKMNDSDAAVQAYDKAIESEQSSNGYWAKLTKGFYFAEKERFEEGAEIFEELLMRDDLEEEDKKGIINNLEYVNERLR